MQSIVRLKGVRLVRYKLKILTKFQTYGYILRDISMYDWDSILGFDASQETLRRELNSLPVLKRISSLMISQSFFDEFYEIISTNREHSFLYKYQLPTIFFAVQYSLVEKIAGFKEPSLVYVESAQDANGTFIKYPHIDDRWNYKDLVSG
ncbi:Hypothetical protein BHY_1062 (plasmid) [Borrelia nietonii YOR]|uniref:Uncharacterized protein n=2 Tax=Borrelia TaxID=138 RepID=W5SBD1_9SPIR|nr:Hypothetical protein BHY_1062 [Borrelia nietonii YOR]AHH14580.1 Hypothetical protein BHW_0021500 [Borrelia hermsii MTW]